MSFTSFYDTFNDIANPISPLDENAIPQPPSVPTQRSRQVLKHEESYSSVFTFTSETPSESIRELYRIAERVPNPPPTITEKRSLARCGSTDTFNPAPTLQPIISSDLEDPNVSSCVRDSKHLQIRQWIQGVPAVEPSMTLLRPTLVGKSSGQYPTMDQFLGRSNNILPSECSESDCRCHYENANSSLKGQARTFYGTAATTVPNCVYPPLTCPELDMLSSSPSPSIKSSSESTLVGSINTPPKTRTRKATSQVTRSRGQDLTDEIDSSSPQLAKKNSRRQRNSLGASSTKPARYICHLGCGHEARTPGDLKRHLQSKIHREAGYECRHGCKSVFTRADSEKRHAKNCVGPTAQGERYPA